MARLQPRKIFQNLVAVAYSRGNVYFQIVACWQPWTLNNPERLKARYTLSCPRLSACPLLDQPVTPASGSQRDFQETIRLLVTGYLPCARPWVGSVENKTQTLPPMGWVYEHSWLMVRGSIHLTVACPPAAPCGLRKGTTGTIQNL